MFHHSATNVLLLFVLVTLLRNIATHTVYTVTPDDHYYPNTTCHHCHNLQHYLLNVTKYFTSNTQLLFLPGLHHLHTDLIIQNVHNISLIGSTANGTIPDAIIHCYQWANVKIAMTNIVNLMIHNLTVNNCGTRVIEVSYLQRPTTVGILLNYCYNMQLNNIIVQGKDSVPETAYILPLENNFGISTVTDLTCYGITIEYNQEPDLTTNCSFNKLLIKELHVLQIGISYVSTMSNNVVIIKMLQYYLCTVEIEFYNITFRFFTNINLFDIQLHPNRLGNLIYFNLCIFESIHYSYIPIAGDLNQASIILLQQSQEFGTLYNREDKPFGNHKIKFFKCVFYRNRLG